MTGSFIHPALIMIAGALLLPFIRGPFRKPYLCLVPILAFCDVLYLNQFPEYDPSRKVMTAQARGED